MTRNEATVTPRSSPDSETTGPPLIAPPGYSSNSVSIGPPLEPGCTGAEN